MNVSSLPVNGLDILYDGLDPGGAEMVAPGSCGDPQAPHHINPLLLANTVLDSPQQDLQPSGHELESGAGHPTVSSDCGHL